MVKLRKTLLILLISLTLLFDCTINSKVASNKLNM